MASDIYSLLQQIFQSIEQQSSSINQLTEIQAGMSEGQTDILDKNRKLLGIYEVHSRNHQELINQQTIITEKLMQLSERVLALEQDKEELKKLVHELYELHTEEIRTIKKQIASLK